MRQFKGFQRGVNLGGWYSQCDHSEQRYDTFIRDEDFAVIRSWGADHVRVPVDYELLENDDGSPRESGYARLEHTITLCRANGLNMVLDLHKTAGFSFDPGEQEAGFFENETYQERFFRLWERIAEHFRSYSDMLAFELLNEVTEQAYCDTWNRIASECIRRIRTLAPTVNILVGGYWHNSAVSVKDIDVPIDEHTLAFGEVGLTGELRGASQAEQRVKEAVKLGYQRIIFPAANARGIGKELRKYCMPVHSIREAIAIVSQQK